MIASQVSKRDVGLAMLLSTLLLGTVVARADQHEDPARKPPAEAPSQPAQPDDTGPTQVGSKDSNVDEDSSSGSYYPYSAGTVGDDPAEPTSTKLPADTGQDEPGPTDQWGDTADADGDGYLSRAELTEAAPALVPNFEAMDVNSDAKLTRGEFRAWHESHKARATDDEARTTTDDSVPIAPRPPNDGGN